MIMLESMRDSGIAVPLDVRRAVGSIIGPNMMHYEIRRFIIIVATGILWLSATVLVFLVVALLHTH